MHKHDSYLNEHEAGISGFKSGIFLTLASICFIFMLNSCGQSSKSDVSNTEDSEATEYFHADNDIAMTVRSLADAIKVGEPLDSTEYDFNGVLTDGQGAPLYTDVQGSPGTWIVDVLDKKNVIIRNLYLGDLLPGDLEAYILQSLRLNESHKMSFTAHDAVNDEETQISVYDFNGGYLRFEIRAAIAPNGLEGPLLTIFMSADPPAGVETQTNA
ncbi:MAG: hypothetical protein K1V90_07465 [Muribaculaceae bacterium]|jgi:hypothetical protein